MAAAAAPARSKIGALLLFVLLVPFLLLTALASAGVDGSGIDSVKRVLKACRQAEQEGAEDEAQCVARGLYSTRVAHLLHEIMDGVDARGNVERAFSAHVCREGLGTTAEPTPVKSETWGHDGQSPIRVDTLFESPRGHAGVYLAHGFVSIEECAELRRRVGPQLIEASEYASFDPNEEDSAVLDQRLSKPQPSSSRKALAAVVEPDLSDPNDPLAVLQTRVFALANRFRPTHNASWSLGPVAQEPLNVIEYARLGDEYKLHCDTHCDGLPLIPHGRVATAVLYCEEPTRGGATAFPGIDIMIQGRKGQALLFHYAGDADAAPPDTAGWRAGGVVDNGFTVHTGCPVLEGTKLITAQWMRAGVSEREPWRLYRSEGTTLQ